MKEVPSTHSRNAAEQGSQRSALVERVVSSKLFEKSPRLRAFFQYVCESRLNDSATEDLKEQQIGINVFHRPPGYNTGEDSIVRVQAHELRKKLAFYFETEGKAEPVVIIIPKGGYLPVFVPANSPRALLDVTEMPAPVLSTHPAALSPAAPSVDTGFFETNRRSIKSLSFIFGALVLLTIGWASGHEWKRQSTDTSPDLKAYSFYSQLLGPMGLDGQNTLLVLSNPRVILYSGLLGLSSTDERARQLIPVPPNLRKLLENARNPGENREAPTYLAPSNEVYTGIGEAASAFNVEKLMLDLHRSVQLTQGRFLNSDLANREHLIILGSPKLSPWTLANVPARNFVLGDNSWLNSSPLPGELANYTTTLDTSGRPLQDYGIISMYTDPTGRRILVLAGHTGAGTQGTGDFFVKPEKMKIVFDSLSAKAHGKPFPKSWEVLVHIRIRDNIPIDSDYVTDRSNDMAK